MAEHCGPSVKAAGHPQTKASAHSAETGNGLPRNLPREILQDIILQSFEHAIKEDVEYNKRFASVPEYGITILPDTSDSEHWSRVLKLALPNNADDVEYVLGKIVQEVQERCVRWKYTEYAEYRLQSIAGHHNVLLALGFSPDHSITSTNYVAAQAEGRVSQFASDYHVTPCHSSLCLQCVPLLESNILQDESNHQRLRCEIRKYQASVKADLGSRQVVRKAVDKLLPKLLKRKIDGLRYVPTAHGMIVNIIAMTAYGIKADDVGKVADWHYKLKDRNLPSEWKVSLKYKSTEVEFTKVFQKWAQLIERTYTYNLHATGRFLGTYPARKPLLDEYTASMDYWERLESHLPTPKQHTLRSKLRSASDRILQTLFEKIGIWFTD